MKDGAAGRAARGPGRGAGPGGAAPEAFRARRIESPRNPEVREAAKLLGDAGRRRETGLFVVEGTKLVREALSRVGPDAVEHIYVRDAEAAPDEEAEELLGLWRELARAWGQTPTWATPAALRRMADARTPPAALALVRRPRAKAAAVLARPGPAGVLDGVQDPGNVGACIRAAAAFGAAGAIVGPGSADPFGPKAVRGSAGAVLWLPVAEEADLASVLGAARSLGRPVVVLDPRGEPLDQVLDGLAGRRAPAFLLGNEGHGPSRRLLDLADAVAAIPRARGVESLNVAAAAALAFYEAARRTWAPTGAALDEPGSRTDT